MLKKTISAILAFALALTLGFGVRAAGLKGEQNEIPGFCRPRAPFCRRTPCRPWTGLSFSPGIRKTTYFRIIGRMGSLW